ncbi:MAG TPA: hypothetical protein ENN81_06125, partial [Phycisphaerales bacterium]|nr:hypothetical protein [Phycisphaerales bacterium]
MSNRAIVLFVLRATGVAMLGALVFVFCPFGWMAAIHARMGLGTLEYTPVASYLIRTLSAMYAVLGALLLFMSSDVMRYRELIRFFGAIAVIGGLAVTVFDAALRLPLWWTALEG